MVLVLKRLYFPEAPQGILEWNDKRICHTIELPWLENLRQKSCIPEGEYILQERYSSKFKWHLHLLNVPGRDAILIHPANDALKELKGCIAPVTLNTGIGKGSDSRKALSKIQSLVNEAFERKQKVKLIIQSN
jgi:hypothetical protein